MIDAVTSSELQKARFRTNKVSADLHVDGLCGQLKKVNVAISATA
jgi:hypothetical protein